MKLLAKCYIHCYQLEAGFVSKKHKSVKETRNKPQLGFKEKKAVKREKQNANRY